MTRATVASNRDRIISVEEDVTTLEDRVSSLERSHLEVLTKLDIIIKMGRVIMAVVAATLGLEVGIEGGIV